MCVYIYIYVYIYTHIYIYISSLWTSFPISSPQCTEFPVLYSRFSLVINVIYSINTVHVSNPISQFKWGASSYWSEWPSSKNPQTINTGEDVEKGEASYTLGDGTGSPLQYYCLENSMDSGTWRTYSPWGHKESDTTEWLTLECVQFKACPFWLSKDAF